MRTFPAMITISIGLGLNQLRLHRGEKWTCSRPSSAQWTRGKSHLSTGRR
jgi:hypothetical protein